MVFKAISIYLLLQKIAWAACCVGDIIFGCKLLIFMGWDEYGDLLTDKTS